MPLHNFKVSFHGHQKRLAFIVLFLFLGAFFATGVVSDNLHHAYLREISVQIRDRNNAQLALLPNPEGAYMTIATGSSRMNELVIRSEDRFFYFHPGVNPWSALRSLFHFVLFHEHVGGSTITQQLTKNLLHHENNRTVKNKLIELGAAFALELHTSKSEILSMYLNSAYFGNQRKGVGEAAKYYFGKNAEALSDGEIVRLLALLSSPSFPPGSAGNTEKAKVIAKRISVSDIGTFYAIPRSIRENRKDPALFELSTLIDCRESCDLTVDRELTQKIREIVRVNLASPKFASVENAAVAVIKLGEGNDPNTLLALVGTPDPYGTSNGNQINMTLASRPIGSTWKPFIYGKALEHGARPYTLIDDLEYRYEIGTGYAFYPKNYDGIYRGPVTLHYALSNSLNVPAVRALQFDGVDQFGMFMKDTLGFIPRQSFDTYQLSIALGGLEMNPLLLAQYFSVFPRDGILAPLALSSGKQINIPMAQTIPGMTRVFQSTTTELLNKMLSDRLMGVEQFGLESNLNLPFQEYAVKTGTSYDYHDSWTVGYTPDVVVVAWIGNSDNKAMDLLTGSRGAGKIWHDVMALLFAEGDIAPRKFDAHALVPVTTAEGVSFGLDGDDVTRARTLLKNNTVVLEPHDGDVLQFEHGMSVPLRGTIPLSWNVNGQFLGVGSEVFWTPQNTGTYRLDAHEQHGVKSTVLQIQIVE